MKGLECPVSVAMHKEYVSVAMFHTFIHSEHAHTSAVGVNPENVL
jgi:hypothetical protein